MKRSTYSVATIFGIWRTGCGNTIPFRSPPWRCRECTWYMIRAAARSVLRLHWWGRYDF